MGSFQICVHCYFYKANGKMERKLDGVHLHREKQNQTSKHMQKKKSQKIKSN